MSTFVRFKENSGGIQQCSGRGSAQPRCYNPGWMYLGIEHLAIASPDPKRLADWYVECLGFAMVHADGGAYFVRAANGALLEIIAAEGERAAAVPRSPGLRHLAIAVDDFSSAYQNLKDRHVAFTGAPYENQGNQLVFFKDADGNLLHLIERRQALPSFPRETPARC